MRFTTIILVAIFLVIGCENPQDLSNEQTLYKGRVIQNERAPFLLDANSLSKISDGLLVLDEEVPEGTYMVWRRKKTSTQRLVARSYLQRLGLAM